MSKNNGGNEDLSLSLKLVNICGFLIIMALS